jgi:hypothetical protein
MPKLFIMKLPALKGGASREGNFLLYCAPSCLPVGRDPAPKGGAYGTLAGPDREVEESCL